MTKKVALILSGSGVFDGSEIHESVICLLALAQAGHQVACFAPDIPQRQVVNHLTHQAVPSENRNVLVESARIARGAIAPLSQLRADDFDALLLPGGFGAASNLSNYAEKGEKCSVLPELTAIILAFHRAHKPIGATCITPFVLAKIFEPVVKARMTVGSSSSEQKTLERMGAEAELAHVDEVISDEKNRIYTTPCYMEKTNLAGLYQGITKLVNKLLG